MKRCHYRQVSFVVPPTRQHTCGSSVWHTERDCSTSTAGSFSRSSSGSEGPPPLIDADLEDNFRIVVDGEVIVFDDVTKQVLCTIISSDTFSLLVSLTTICHTGCG